MERRRRRGEEVEEPLLGPGEAAYAAPEAARLLAEGVDAEALDDARRGDSKDEGRVGVREEGVRRVDEVAADLEVRAVRDDGDVRDPRRPEREARGLLLGPPGAFGFFSCCLTLPGA